jgi:hypothetical protein
MTSYSQLQVLARFILPDEVFDYFDITEIKESGKSLHLYLEEQNLPPQSYSGEKLLSKGFHQEVTIKDFPLRDKAVFLHVKRRRWYLEKEHKVISRDWNLVADGTQYTQGFASFLKGLIGYLPDPKPFP